MAIQYPITVNKINFLREDVWSRGRGDRVGSFVSVRPCGDMNPEGKTFLGLYLGDIAALGLAVGFDQESGELTVYPPSPNPAIFVFDLNRVVFGFQSWWGVIESEEQLRTITDADINNVWYVKSLQTMAKEEAG